MADLLESIMHGFGLVKEELRRISSTRVNLNPNSQKSGFPLFGCPEKSQIALFAIFGCASGQIFQK